MGHYYSEMACSTCGRIPCECPKKPDLTHRKWLVDPVDLAVMQVQDFDRKYKYIQAGNGMVLPGNPYARRMDAALFDSREAAMAHRVNVVDEQIKRQKAKMNEAAVQIQVLEMKKDKL